MEQHLVLASPILITAYVQEQAVLSGTTIPSISGQSPEGPDRSLKVTAAPSLLDVDFYR